MTPQALVEYHSMRTYLIFFFLFVLSPLCDGAGNTPFDTASRLARSGAPYLALARVERDQPAQAAHPQWLRWEALRLSLLVDLNRDQEVLQRVLQLPPEIPVEFRTLYLSAAQAAQKTKDPALTRRYLAKLLWSGEPGDEQKKEARQMVIQSYLAQHRPDTAHLAMLRFQQDYQPLSAPEVARFVEQLLLAGGVVEAGDWLAQLDDASPLKLLLRLKAEQISPDAAIAAASAALNPPQSSPSISQQSALLKAKIKKNFVKPLKPSSTPPAKLSEKDIAAYWYIIAHAAGLQKNPILQAEALERGLNMPTPQDDGVFDVDPENLRQVYAEIALMTANQAQLLAGDDTAWFDLATHAPSSLAARALFASLSPQNTSLELRLSAETNLTLLLLDSKLDVTAMRLFADDAHFPAANRALLVMLGEVAMRNRIYPLAAKYWRGVNDPQTEISALEWQLKRVQAFVMGGLPDEAVNAMRRVYADKLPIDHKAAAIILQIARELEARLHPGAEMILLRLAPLTDGRHWGEIYLTLGRIAEGRKEFTRAAEYYLQAADWSEGTKARMQAADCLVRANLKEDAKRQYTLLLKSVKTPAERDAVKQALNRL